MSEVGFSHCADLGGVKGPFQLTDASIQTMFCFLSDSATSSAKPGYRMGGRTLNMVGWCAAVYRAPQRGVHQDFTVLPMEN